jgi:phage terminase large subunit
VKKTPIFWKRKWSMGRQRMTKGHIVVRCTTRLAHNSVIFMRTARKSTGETFKKNEKNGVMPKKETLQRYNITQEEIDECIPKK